MDKIHSGVDAGSAPQVSFYTRTDPDLPIVFPRFTLPSRQPPLEEITTLQMLALENGVEYNLSIFETSPISMIVEEQTLASGDIEQIVTLRVPAISELLDVDDDEASGMQTVSMRAVKKKRARNRVKTAFAGSVLLLMSMLFLSLLVVAIVLMPDLICKVQVLIVLFIAISYVVSVQLKRIRRARQQKYVTVARFLRTVKKGSSAKDDDMEHLKLIKQDTMTYLRALTAKQLKKD